jgi:hypothetical protein
MNVWNLCEYEEERSGTFYRNGCYGADPRTIASSCFIEMIEGVKLTLSTSPWGEILHSITIDRDRVRGSLYRMHSQD